MDNEHNHQKQQKILTKEQQEKHKNEINVKNSDEMTKEKIKENEELIQPLHVEIPENQPQKIIIDKQCSEEERISKTPHHLLNSKQQGRNKEIKQPLLLQQHSPKFKQNCSLSTGCCPCCTNTQNEITSFTPPPNLTTVADRFVLQHYSKAGSGGTLPISGIPRKKAPQHRRLRKYASETSFCSSPGSSFGSVGSGASLLHPSQCPGRIRTVTLMNGRSRNSGGDLGEETPSPPLIITAAPNPLTYQGCEREVRTGARVFHVRPSGTSSQQSAHLACAGSNTLINRLHHQRRCQPQQQLSQSPQSQEIRKDSGDDASCSLGSGSTQGSNSQQTPLSQRRIQIIQMQQKQQHPFTPSQQQQRFKMRRPRSTGQIIIQQIPNSKKKYSETQECNYSIEQNSGGSSSTTAGQSGPDNNHRCRTMSSGTPYNIHQNHSSNCVANNISSINNNNNNKGNNSSVGYDPSYTSATVYSTDSIINIHSACGQPTNPETVSGTCTGSGAPMTADAIIPVDRRPSNYYLFEDDSAHEFDDEDEFDNVTLMYSKHEKIPMKDFGSEIRATMDIDHLLNKAVLLLDLQETSLEEIFAKIIHEMDIQEPEFTSEQVRSVLFTQDAGNQFHILSRTVQSICTTGTVGGTFDYDQTWICALCMLSTVQHRHVAIARLSHPTNLGRTMQDLRFIIIVIAPSRAKGTKTALETTRTFATLFADMDIRQRLVMAHSVEAFRATLLEAAKELALEQSQWRERKSSIHLSQAKEQVFGLGKFFPFRGLIEDFKMRKKHYISDYLDGLRGHRTMQKMFSSIIFLYFACLLPAIAFGVLNDDNTGGRINVRKGILAQAIGGVFFAAFGGQPMIILLTTVPLAIYIKVIYRISESLGYDFFAMYACVGLWCQFFLVIYAATELCSLMKLATRSAEEMFSLFIAIAFAVESVRAIHTSFIDNYLSCIDPKSVAQPQNFSLLNQKLLTNTTELIYPQIENGCNRDTFILYLLLMFGTLWVALFLYNFRKTPYLTRSRREWLADYALPASVLIMSFLGEYTFFKIYKDIFHMRADVSLLKIPEFWRLSWQAIFVCFILGFFLSFLFYMDQNICSSIVNNNQNKLKKGSAQHLDLLVVSILNMFLSVMGLPWMHGALPHSPLHVRALADVEERVAQGHVHEVIMNVRETRLATLIAHILILASTFFLLPYLQLIPTSVLHGLFLYMAFTSLSGNEMVERLLLLITEQQAYPPTHYIRRVPQRKVHLFTTCQLIQLIILCAVGFSPYPFIEMVFPIVCFCFLPIRHILIPRIIDYKYLDALDGRH
uniref:Bicarbonate transporter-like transmembrane domain-containing protein n=1 Tax=Meloidogyne enterolobii TaxID=390850 RepID=A0A6V7V188_MELEN|nr:unnamed protein product [Meloidogyne enterolobii]